MSSILIKRIHMITKWQYAHIDEFEKELIKHGYEPALYWYLPAAARDTIFGQYRAFTNRHVYNHVFHLLTNSFILKGRKEEFFQWLKESEYHNMMI